MHRSHITMKQWLIAIYELCNCKKGIAALELQTKLSLGSYKSAWFLAHRLRAAMQEAPLNEKLSGMVEVDETYVGGRSREGRRGRGSERKTPVLVLVQRDGRARSKPVQAVDGKHLKAEILANVDPSATILTDEMGAYYGIGAFFQGGHHVVTHGAKEYSRGFVHTNTAESYFSSFKRGYVGVYHFMSKGHLFRYCVEFGFRWDRRKLEHGERIMALINKVGGKRLFYRQPKSAVGTDALIQ